MIPLRDYKPTPRIPFMTIMLIVLNIAFFVRDRMTGQVELVRVNTDQGVVMAKEFIGGITSQCSLVPIDLVSQPLLAWPTIFCSMFLHGNLLHIGSNMLFLWVFGDNIEDALGRAHFLAFYLVCGLIAAIVQVLSDPASNIPMVGASGAVAGVLGAYLVLFPKNRILTLVPLFIFFTTVKVPAYLIIGYWALLQFINAYLLKGGVMRGGGVAYFAHIGGFVAGIILIMLLVDKRHQSSWRR